MKNKLGYILGSAVLILPFMALAQPVPGTDASGLINGVINFISGYIIPLIVGIAILFFMYGVLTYIRAAGDEEKRKEGRNMMIYGIIAIAVMLSVIGLVSVLTNSFAFTSIRTVNPPILPPVR